MTHRISVEDYHRATWNLDALEEVVTVLIDARRHRMSAQVVVPRVVDRQACGTDFLSVPFDTILVIEGLGALQWNTEGLRSTRILCETPSLAVGVSRKLDRPGRIGLTDEQVLERYQNVERHHDAWNTARAVSRADYLYNSQNGSK